MIDRRGRVQSARAVSGFSGYRAEDDLGVADGVAGRGKYHVRSCHLSDMVDYAYVADSSGLAVYEINVVGKQMSELYHYQLAGFSRRAVLAPDHLYVASGTGGVNIIERTK